MNASNGITVFFGWIGGLVPDGVPTALFAIGMLIYAFVLAHAAGTGRNRTMREFAYYTAKYMMAITAGLACIYLVSSVLLGLLGIHGFVIFLMAPIPLYFWRNAGKV